MLKKKLESQQSLLPRGRLGGRANVVWTRDIYESGFSYPNAQVCPNDGLDIRLIILITSAPNHFSARDAIRLTWGHYAQRLDVSMAFIIGKQTNIIQYGVSRFMVHFFAIIHNKSVTYRKYYFR